MARTMSRLLEDLDTRIRPWCAGDREYVLATWKQAEAPKAPPPWKEVQQDCLISILTRSGEPDPWYWAAQEAMIGTLIARGTIRVICSKEFPSLILAWACIEDGCVHYAYVKKHWRGKGLARELTQDCDTTTAGRVRVSWLKYDPRRLK